MKKILYVILSCLCFTATYLPIKAFSLESVVKQTKEKIMEIFEPASSTEIFQKDIPRTTQKTLVVDNKTGQIKLKTDWNQNTISVKAIKKATADNLAKIAINIDTTSTERIIIKTAFSDENIKGSVDYTLIVPRHMTVRLKTSKGSIKVKRFDGQVWANTDNGTISIANVSDKINASVTESGSIEIEQAQGPIQATTAYGDIDIHNAKQSVLATTEHGNINLHAACVPSTSSLNLNASGSVNIYLPEDTNAHVRAEARHGKIISDHYITLSCPSTKLNNQAWVQLQKNIEGTIGSGEAEILLKTSGGPIKIFNDTATA